MGIHGLRRGLRRLSEKRASTLAETLVSLVVIGIAGLMMASGIATALRLYTAGSDIDRRTAEVCRRLYLEDESSLTVMTGCAEYFADGIPEIVTYSVEIFGDGSERFYYYGGAEEEY